MQKLIDQLIVEGYLKTPEIIDAFRKVGREFFLLPEMKDHANLNIPLSIHFGQTISQPLTVAFMLELLHPRLGDAVLDVGAGSGWQTALLAQIVGPKGKVVAIERIPQLAAFAKKNVLKFSFSNITFVQGDGSKGYRQEAPFDRIVVAAASKNIPHELVEQLRSPGKLVMPVGEWDQEMVLLEKDAEGKTHKTNFPGFQFVPLVEGDI